MPNVVESLQADGDSDARLHFVPSAGNEFGEDNAGQLRPLQFLKIDGRFTPIPKKI